MHEFKEVDAGFVLDATRNGAHVIDVRTEAEVAQGIIDGAIHIPLHLLPLRGAEIPQDKPVVMYCRTGARSAQACAHMAGQGFRNMHNLSGGIMSWTRSGHAVRNPH